MEVQFYGIFAVLTQYFSCHLDLKAMFEPRPIIEYKPPARPRKHDASYTGVSQYLSLFETTPPPAPTPFVPPAERKIQMKEKLQALHAEKNDLMASSWDPSANPKATEYVETLLTELHLYRSHNFVCFVEMLI